MSETIEEFKEVFFGECVKCKLGEIERPEECKDLPCVFEWDMLEIDFEEAEA